MGSRLGNLTSKIPKCMVKLNDIPLIYYQKKILESFNKLKKNIYVITGYKSNKINIKEFKKFFNPDFKTTNMLYSLFYNRELLNEEIIITYGDIIYSKKILQNLMSSKAKISVVVDMKWFNYWKNRFKNPLDDAESLKINKLGYITEIGSKVSNIKEIHGQYIGLIKLTKIGTELFKEHFDKYKYFNGKNFKNAYLTDFLKDMIDKGVKIKAIPIYNSWVEIDNPSDISNKVTSKRLKEIFHE